MNNDIILSIQQLPVDFCYVAINGTKAPYIDGWQHSRLNLEAFTKAHGNDSRCHAVGLLTGKPSGGILAVDHDGSSCNPLIERLSGLAVDEALPHTIKFSSGRPGRYQAVYWVPSQYWPYIDGKKVIKTGVIGDDGKSEQLEFRWSGHQSVIAGSHPETEGYQWVERCSPSEAKIAPCPSWVLRQIVQFDLGLPGNRKKWTDREWAISYLAAIPPSENYDEWLKVGMCLKSADADLLDIWEYWSSLAENHNPGECTKKWDSFKRDDLTIATLGAIAKEHGWKGKDREASKPLVEQDTNSLNSEVTELLSHSHQSLELSTILHPHLADPLTQLAARLNVPPVVYAHNLLPVAASLLKTGTELEVSPSTGHYAKPIIWTGVVAPSGAVKSPPYHHITEPLVEYQNQLYEKHAFNMAEYEKAFKKWEQADEETRGDKPEEPQERDLYFNDITIEALAADIAKTPDCGALIAVDELGGFFTGLNQYKGGKGNDRQRWLSCYDGKSLKINRKTQKRVFLSKTSLSMTGTVQPEVLQRLMGNLHEVDGLWPRYLWITLPLTKMPPPDEGGKLDLSDRLLNLYQYLDSLQVFTYRLSREAKQVWRQWHIWTEETKVNEGHPALRAVYPKAREQAARISLVLHCINSYFTGELSEEVSAETIQSAIAYTRYCIAQAKLVYADFGICDNPESARIVRFVERFKTAGWIKPRQVTHWWSPKPKPTAEKTREFMELVVKLGYAIDNEQEGKDYQIQIKTSGNTGNSGNKLPESLLNQDSENSSNGNKLGNSVVTSDNNLESLANPQNSGIQICYQNGGNKLPDLLPHHADLNAPKINASRNLLPLLPENIEVGNKVSDNCQKQSEGNEGGAITDDVVTGNKIEVLCDPREAIIRSSSEIRVDLDKLSLSYEPSVQIPDWQSSKQVKPYEQVRKLYLDIETTGLEPESDCIIMIGLMTSDRQRVCLSDPDEAALLRNVLDYLKQFPPDILVGHNLFNFDLPFIAARCIHHGIKHPFKRDDRARTISASSFHGKPIEYTPVRLPEVQIVDTFHQVAIWDKQAAKLTSYSLKNSVIALGLRSDRRLELSVDQIRECWQTGDLQTLAEYLEYDLEDTQLLADFLLPVVWYQQNWVPGLSFQYLAVASPALKAQKIHEALGLTKADADQPVKYGGGLVECHTPGLHRNVAKIDVSSLYPSIMLRYGICSRKDPDHKFLAVMRYMTQERLRLKTLAKSGDKLADQQQGALKILINGSYGFLGTAGYSYNDMEAAALVTAYGRKILRLMQQVCTDHEATLIESDTDGIMFSSDTPQTVYEAVQKALPEGINIELELSGCGVYVPKAKTYVIVHPSGKVTVKGLFRKRDRYPLQNTFPIEFIKRYFQDSPESAEAYYQNIQSQIEAGEMDISQLTITRKIRKGEKKLIELGIGMKGDTVSYWYGEQKRYHSISKKPIKSVPRETITGQYWAEFYQQEIDQEHTNIIGGVRPSKQYSQHPLLPLEPIAKEWESY